MRKGNGMDEKGKMYQYPLKLSEQNPVENELLQAIRERDRLEYPSVKLFILKKILRNDGSSLAESQRIKELEQGQQQIKEQIGQLIREVEDLKQGKHMTDESQGREKVFSQQIKEQAAEKSEASYEINGLDDDFAADFLKNYDI